ncbi:MFS transporter [Candidatus Aerophobetes bacterium]|nr:MFS transporter [Candidatus Aerophobetes bacterium]
MKKRQGFIFYILPFFVDIAFGILLICIPLLAIKIGANSLELGGLGFIITLFYIFFCVLFGKLSDRYKSSHFLWISCLICFFLSFAFLLSHQLYQLFLFMGILGIASAMFWPSIEVLIAKEGGKLLIKRTSKFNASWCLGSAIGFLAGGPLFQINTRLPFYFSGLIFLILVFFIFISIKEINHFSLQETSSKIDFLIPSGKSSSSYLYTAWLANFTLWFSISIVRYLFPKLSTNLGFSPSVLGILFSCISLAQTITFYALGKLSFWYYQKSILIFTQMVAIIALIITFLTSNVLTFIGAFALLGISVGITHSASLFYTLNTPENRGIRAGIHEGILGLGGLFGPLTGGILATQSTLRAPYLLAIIVIGASIAAQVFFKFKKKKL